MSLDVWKKIEPLEGISGKYLIKSIINNPTSLKIVLINDSDKSNQLSINFLARVFSYKKTVLRYKEHLIEILNGEHGPVFTNEWTLFKVENSSYAKWVSKQSCEIFKAEIMLHYAFITSDSLVEVLAAASPEVHILR